MVLIRLIKKETGTTGAGVTIRSRRLDARSKSLNLYRFIRLVLGRKISDRRIARRWGMDQKNFSEFKNGKTPVPRIEKLAELAEVLGVNKHLVFETALGAPADKVFNLIRKNDLKGQVRLLFGPR